MASQGLAAVAASARRHLARKIFGVLVARKLASALGGSMAIEIGDDRATRLGTTLVAMPSSRS